MIRFVGDVHQHYDVYMSVLPKTGVSMQVGDLGFDYSYLNRINLDPDRHKAISGNHDCFAAGSKNYFKNQPFFLGDHGVHKFPGEPSIFYVRGGWSIDHAYRRQGVDWWPEEELSYRQLEEAIELYGTVKPDLVVSHEAPYELVKYLTEPSFARRFGYENVVKTRTNTALQMMFEAHRPKAWVFGHYHRSWEGKVGPTRFVCLDMLTMKGKISGCTVDL